MADERFQQKAPPHADDRPARRRLSAIVDMLDRRLNHFIRLCLQGQGRLSAKKRERVGDLTDEKVTRMETVIRSAVSRIPDGADLTDS